MQCKLCSQCFVEGQTLRVPDSKRHSKPDSGITNSLAAEQMLADNGEKEVPVFGYQVSMHMACELVEVYRDSNFPLSLVAKDILLDYGTVADLPHDSGPRGGALASTDQSHQTAPKERAGPVSVGRNLRKKRSGWMLVCYHCFTILEEHHYYKHTSDKLYRALGIDAANSTSAGEGPVGGLTGVASMGALGTQQQRPRSANRARRSASDSNLPTAPTQAAQRHTGGDFSTQCVRYGRPEPWTRASFERYHSDCSLPSYAGIVGSIDWLSSPTISWTRISARTMQHTAWTAV